MTTSPVDAVIIGAGSGGLTVAVGLSTFGKKVVMVERNHVGGDCTNVGCIPSKSLLHHSAHQDGRDSKSILATVRERRDYLRDHETEEFGSMDNIDLVFGAAKIEAPGTVAITAADGTVERIETKHIVVATGSSPRRLPVPGLPDDRYLTNEELFEQDQS